MAYYKVEICGINTSKLPVLTNDEKKELLDRIDKGDKEARETFINGNLRLVLSIVSRFARSNENLDDLFQVGCIGLIKALDNFDRNLNVQFSTYACPMIIGEIRRYLRDSTQIRVSRSLKDIAYKVMTARERFMNTNGREATVNEISEEIGIPKENILMSMDAMLSPVSLYEKVYQDGTDTLYIIDQVKDKLMLEENIVDNLVLKDAFELLNDREKVIMELRYFSGKTQTEVADMIGVSQAQVSRMEKQALKKMKRFIGEKSN